MRAKRILCFFLFLLLISFVSANKFNLASSVKNPVLDVVLGGEVIGTTYFFNVNGDTPTFIIGEVLDVPNGFNVKLKPSEHTINKQRSNIIVEPMNIVDEIPIDPIKDIVYLNSYLGFIPSKQLDMIIKVNDNVPKGKYNIVLSVKGFWTQEGMVVFEQKRNFDFTVNVIAKNDDMFEDNILGTRLSKIPQRITTRNRTIDNTSRNILMRGQAIVARSARMVNVDNEDINVSWYNKMFDWIIKFFTSKS